MLVKLPICMQETQHSCGPYGTCMSCSSLATKDDNKPGSRHLSFVTLLKKIHHPLLFRLHLPSSNHQDVQNVSVSTFDINMIYIRMKNDLRSCISIYIYIVNAIYTITQDGTGVFCRTQNLRRTPNDVK